MGFMFENEIPKEILFIFIYFHYLYKNKIKK